MINTAVRCFRRPREGGRRGIWLMTGSRRGVFFHGNREEAQTPEYTISELERMVEDVDGKDWFHVEEITPEETIEELESWPEAQRDAMRIFGRHPKEEER